MIFKECNIKGLFVITPRVFKDDRGYFFESFNKFFFINEMGVNIANFLQDNQSKSSINVLRGLHFQNPPNSQAKLVRVLSGSVLDVVVDIRKNSPTYGNHYKIVLSSENFKMLYVPEGFAHGFLTLEDNTIFSYKCTSFYNKESEGSILWNDTTLNIDWKIKKPILSEKDEIAQKFCSFVSKF